MRVWGARRRLAGRKPLLIYDGRCGFCRRWIQRWRSITGDAVSYAPYQQVAWRFPELGRKRFREAVHLIEPDGRVVAGAEAVFRSLACAGRYRILLRLFHGVPGFAWMANLAYRFVAHHRSGFGRLDRMLYGSSTAPTTELVGHAFVSAVGLAYLAAFLSLRPQIRGLVGDRGILPVREHLDILRRELGAGAYLAAPTLCWFDPGDRMLRRLCTGGAILSSLAVAGIAPAAVLLLMWASYLSLVVAGQEFLRYQWDTLLLEAGLLAIFAAPLSVAPRWSSPPSPAMAWSARWLLARLVFASGAVKLTSHDPAWRKRRAVEHHYQTQPLPTWTAWYAHQLPAWFHRLSVLVVLAIELGAAPLLLGPRRPRRWGVAAILLLQALIAVSGNFGFFNLLTAALALPALDDSVVPSRVRASLGARRERAPRSRPRRWPGWLTVPLAAFTVVLGLTPLLGALGKRPRWLRRLARLRRVTIPFALGNSYGLFAVMTTRRPEIVIEGSDDGEVWLPYEFRWKPGDPTHRPRFTGLHMPRLDWQMWFAALGDLLESPWVLAFMARLLEGSPEVLSLLGHNPFSQRPPRLIRAVLYDYRFTDGPTRARTGAWWTRESIGPFAPVLRATQDSRK